MSRKIGLSRTLLSGALTLVLVLGTLVFGDVRLHATDPSCNTSGCPEGLTCAGPQNVHTAYYYCGDPRCHLNSWESCHPGFICGAEPDSWECPCRFADGTLSTYTCF